MFHLNPVLLVSKTLCKLSVETFCRSRARARAPRGRQPAGVRDEAGGSDGGHWWLSAPGSVLRELTQENLPQFYFSYRLFTYKSYSLILCTDKGVVQRYETENSLSWENLYLCEQLLLRKVSGKEARTQLGPSRRWAGTTGLPGSLTC